MDKQLIRRAGLALFVIGLFIAIRYLAPYTARSLSDSIWIRRAILYSMQFFSVIIWVVIQDGWRNTWTALGLRKGFLIGFGFAFACTLPMLLGYGILGGWNEEMSWQLGVAGALLPGFFEEFFYRGFLFAQLFRKAKWGFILAAAVNAIVFGMGHISQGNNLGESTGVFLVTFIGAAWFAWLFVEWKFNLWVPIFLHILMNLYWMMFAAGENALGGLEANIFRGMTIAATVVFTLRLQKPLTIRKENLLVNPD